MKLHFDLQRRHLKTGRVVVERETFESAKMGAVLIDFWDWHWCKTASERAAAMTTRINRAFECLRPMGVQVFHCPTDVARRYVGTIPREAALAAPRYPLPKLLDIDWPRPRGGDCMCGPGEPCQPNVSWSGMNPGLVICDEDRVAKGTEELYSLCKAAGITTLVYFGLHTNMCLMGKPTGFIPMSRAGMRCILARDANDACTEYDPARGYTPDDGTAEVDAHIERHMIPSIHIVDELTKAGCWHGDWIVEPVRCAPWGTRARPHIFEKPFKATLTIPWLEGAELRYTIDGSEPTQESKLCTGPLTIRATTTVRAMAFRDGRKVSLDSEFVFARLIPMPPLPDVCASDLTPCRAVCPGPEVNRPRFDKTFGCSEIFLQRRQYDKGIGVHSPSQVMFELKGEYDRFVALAGADEKVLWGESGADFGHYTNVIFRVFIDGRLMAQSPCMRLLGVPWRFDVRIPRGSRRISLTTVSGKDTNYLDYGDWVDAGFVLRK